MSRTRIAVSYICITCLLLFIGREQAHTAQNVFIDSGQDLGGNVDSSEVALGDLDGDGDLDAIVANTGSASQVWVNQGGTQAGTPGIYVDSGQTLAASDAVDVGVDDLDGDSDLDIFLVRNAFGDANEVWINQGGSQGGTEGIFSSSGQVFGDDLSTSVALGDLDGVNGPDAYIGRFIGRPSKVWFNDGSGSFSDSGQILDSDSNDLALGDLDGDDDLDAFSANGTENRVWINQGGIQGGTPGLFQDSGQLLGSVLSLAVSLGDVDGDGDLDAYLGNNFSDKLWINQGGAQGGTEGVFQESGQSLSSGQTRDVSLDDLDGDNDLDAFLAKGAGNEVWINQGGDQGGTAGIFIDSLQSLGNSFSEGLDMGDVDIDTDLDAFIANFSDPNKVWLNQTEMPGSGGEGWQVQTVAARAQAGLYSALVLDQNDNPHISYVEFSPRQSGLDYGLYYSYWDGVRWHREFVVLDEHMGDTIGYNAIALDSNGYAHIAYTSGVGSLFLNLQYAYWDGLQWQVETVDGSEDIEAQVDMVLDSNDNPHILFQNDSSDELRYTFWDGTQWQEEVVEGNLTQRTSHALVLDANDRPHISFNDGSRDRVRYAHFDGQSWQLEDVSGTDPLIDAYTDIKLKPDGNPAIAYSWGPFESEVHYAEWNGQNWVDETAIVLNTASSKGPLNLEFDGNGNPHIVFNPGTMSVSFLQHIYKGIGGWNSETLDNNGLVGAFNSMESDSQGQLHVSYYDASYQDLRYVTWGPDWEIRKVESGVVHSPDVQIVNTIPSIGYYRLASGQIKLAQWDGAWDYFPADFVSAPVMDVSHVVGRFSDHIGYYDANNARLMYGLWNGSAWRLLVVDETADVGKHNDIELVGSEDGMQRIAYWDATFNRVKAAALSGLVPSPTVYTNTASPPLNGDSGYTALTILPGEILGVSYYDGVSDDLRFAILNPETGSWTDEMVDGSSVDAGRLNDVRTDGTDGYPVIAYYDETNDAIKLAFDDGAWQIQTAVPSAGGVVDLALELGLGSRTRARIAYTTSTNELKLAVLKDGMWEAKSVHMGTMGLDEVSMALDLRPHLAYTEGGELYYAFRGATLDVDVTLPGPEPPPSSGGFYNPLDACQAVLDLFTGQSSARLSSPASISTTSSHPSGRGDLAIFDSMTGLFANTPGGQFYIDLYRQHGSEMGQIGLDDFDLLQDAWGTLQNFLPGLEALVTGHGSEVLVTQGMVEDALDIWQRLAGAGSPALANVINTELAKYNNLQDFVGMSFDEWALAIGVQPPSTVYLPFVTWHP